METNDAIDARNLLDPLYVIVFHCHAVCLSLGKGLSKVPAESCKLERWHGAPRLWAWLERRACAQGLCAVLVRRQGLCTGLCAAHGSSFVRMFA